MKEQKRLGRGLEEISHLFLTSPGERKGEVRFMPRPLGLARIPRCISVKSLIPFPSNAFLVLLAHALSVQQNNVLMVDFQEPGLDLGSLLGIQKLASTPQAYIGDENISLWVAYPPRIKILSFQLNPKDFEELPSHEREIFQKALLQEEFQTDCLLADIPFSMPGREGFYPSLVHEVLLLCSPGKPFVSEIYLEIKDLLISNEEVKIGLLFSDSPESSEAKESYQTIRAAVQKFLGADLSYEGILPPLSEFLDTRYGETAPLGPSPQRNPVMGSLAQIGARIGKRKTTNPFHIPTPFFEKIFSFKP